ncbi:UNVERIFIED_CONTAM: hypothetical protein Slati_0064600, partial [Sesamum latifolium]
FTPSRGSTPVHHKFSSGNPPANKAPAIEATLGSVSEPSPPDTKKRLSELFKESLRHSMKMRFRQGERKQPIQSTNPQKSTFEVVLTPNVLKADKKPEVSMLPSELLQTA